MRATAHRTTRQAERALAGATIVLVMISACPARVNGQPPANSAATPLPFVAGESLVYDVRVGDLAAGHGTMSIGGPVDVRGVSTLLLRSDMRAGVGMLSGRGRSRSWLDSERMASLRFAKEERRLLVRHRESVELYPDQRRWIAADGRAGKSPTDAPLDELSFIYFIRTLPLAPGTTFSFTRHFEKGRNPVEVTVIGREKITVDAGSFFTVVVEMRVRDPRNYQGEGTIRIHLTDDGCRLPVRIESAIPGIGTTVLSLDSARHPESHCSAHGT